MLRVTQADDIGAFKVSRQFNGGSTGIVDLSGELVGDVCESLRDTRYFRRFRLAGHTLAWANGAEFAPEFF